MNTRIGLFGIKKQPFSTIFRHPMRAGRKPKPTHLKLLAGHPGHRPPNESEPQPDAVDETMQPPAWLSGEARAAWAIEFPKLVRNNMITDIDLNAFARYCQACGRMV